MDNKQTFELKTYLFMHISGSRTSVGVEQMQEKDKRRSYRTHTFHLTFLTFTLVKLPYFRQGYLHLWMKKNLKG